MARSENQPPGSASSSLSLLLCAIWFVVALFAGASGKMAELRPPAPQVVLLGLTLALILAYNLSRSFRDWTTQWDLRALVALHLTRFVGVYFLVLNHRGGLPREFALPAGFGDIAVATLALILITLRPAAERRRLYFLWNSLGLIDILFVVATAARLAFRDPASMAALLRLPLSLLPTFLVPWIIASHLLIFVRLRQPSGLPSSSPHSY
jgi:hypothetical protein